MNLTPRQKHIKRKYTELTRVNGEWMPKLAIGVQSFTVSLGGTRDHARIIRDSLAIALSNLIELERMN